MKTNNESLKQNLIYNIIYQVVTVLSPLIVTPKISRVFGLDYLGVKSFTFSIVYYFAIFGVLGLDMLGQRKIALVKDNVNERSKVFWTIYSTRFFLVLLSTCLYIIYFLIADLSSVEKVVTLYWLIYLFREMINPIWFLQGMEKFKLVSILGIISQIGYVVCTVVFIKQKSDLPRYILFYTVIPLVISFCYFPTVFANVKKARPRFQDMKASVVESVVYFVPTIATAIYSMVDKTMLGMFDVHKISTGLYESSERLVKVALAFSTASFTIMRTRMSYLYGKNDPAAYKKMAKLFMSFSLMLCWPIMFGIMGISKDFVPVFFGKGFEEVVNLSYVFSLVVPCLTVSGLLQAIYIFPYGLQKTMDVYYAIIVIVNIIMNLVLIHFFGTVGAIIASVFAELLLAVILIIRARKDIDVSFFAKGSVKYLVSSVAMLFVMKYISSHLVSNHIIKTVAEFISAVTTYFAICFILRDKFIIEQSRSVIHHIKKTIFKEVE